MIPEPPRTATLEDLAQGAREWGAMLRDDYDANESQQRVLAVLGEIAADPLHVFLETQTRLYVLASLFRFVGINGPLPDALEAFAAELTKALPNDNTSAPPQGIPE
jgi:hypothetical protein